MLANTTRLEWALAKSIIAVLLLRGWLYLLLIGAIHIICPADDVHSPGPEHHDTVVETLNHPAAGFRSPVIKIDSSSSILRLANSARQAVCIRLYQFAHFQPSIKPGGRWTHPVGNPGPDSALADDCERGASSSPAFTQECESLLSTDEEESLLAESISTSCGN